jgi:hypothetical protein
MAEIIKVIPVKDKDEAIYVVASLGDKYQLQPTDPDNTLDLSNENLHVFYDADTQTVTLETNDTGSTEEYLKELLIAFPTLF